jgi:RNA polymerase sigma-70 factor (ECF subfamily)
MARGGVADVRASEPGRFDSGAAPDPVTRHLLAARAGDRAAASAFVRATQDEVHRFVGAIAGPDAADDLAQDTYLRAFHALPRYAGRASARTWLLAIARRVCADHHRAVKRQRRLDRRILTHTIDETEPDPAELTGTADLLQRVSPERRVAFALTQVLGMSYAEAAEIEGVPIGTIRSRVARARSELMEALSEPDGRNRPAS